MSFWKKVRVWLSPNRSPFILWMHRVCRNSSHTFAEQFVATDLRCANYIFWFAWSFCLISMLWEIFWPSAFERSGAVLITAAILIEQKIFRARTALNLIKQGHASPSGYIASSHLPGPYLAEWAAIKVNGVPIAFWLMGQENLMFQFERRIVWLLIVGTVVWGYGTPIIKTLI